MSRNRFFRTSVSGLATLLEVNFNTTDPIAEQVWNRARTSCMISTIASPKGANMLGRDAIHMASPSSSSTLLRPCGCGNILCPIHVRSMSMASKSTNTQPVWAASERAPMLAGRLAEVTKYFPTALSVDDFISRVEIALAGYGFTGDNSIAMSNLCRDESCLVLEDKIEAAFGSCFSTHGLGGVLTCGVIGMTAGLSHSPVVAGKERYVFFSFPHIAIDSEGNIGAVSRPNRPGSSAACGALIACLSDFKRDGLESSVKAPGVHDPLEPEYSILKQRIARRLVYEGVGNPQDLNLVDITQAAERVISTDLEYLISKAVDPQKSDYAVFAGIQIHNWAADLNNTDVPSLEFVAVGRSYVVVNGEKIHLDLDKVPALSPRQLQILAAASTSASDSKAVTAAATSTAAAAGKLVQEIPREYLLRRLGGAQSRSHVDGNNSRLPVWNTYVKTDYKDPHGDAPQMDHPFEATTAPKEESAAANTSFFWGSSKR